MSSEENYKNNIQDQSTKLSEQLKEQFVKEGRLNPEDVKEIYNNLNNNQKDENSTNSDNTTINNIANKADEVVTAELQVANEMPKGTARDSRILKAVIINEKFEALIEDYSNDNKKIEQISTELYDLVNSNEPDSSVSQEMREIIEERQTIIKDQGSNKADDEILPHSSNIEGATQASSISSNQPSNSKSGAGR